MGEPQHANHEVQETRCLAELGERGLTAWVRRLDTVYWFCPVARGAPAHGCAAAGEVLSFVFVFGIFGIGLLCYCLEFVSVYSIVRLLCGLWQRYTV